MIKTIAFSRLFLSLPILAFFFSGSAPSSTWTLKNQKGNIKVYTRTTPKSSIKEVRITTQIKGNLDDLQELLNDVPSFEKWVYKCAKAKKLKSLGPDEFYYYNLTDFPFPLSDRDVIIHSKTWKVPGTNIEKTHSRAIGSDELYKEQEGIVRIKLLEYTWTFTPLDNGMIDIDYQIFSEPGGALPAWVVNMAISKGPMETMIRLKNEMKRRY
ncbi:MAG TPA: hypothetical protein ENK85_07435 [Saprospiraceae bacterium]|nr:hypothetical protein [Saprospiraceae bacterium]